MGLEIKGFEKFVKAFKNYTDNYIVVGGTATSLLLSSSSLPSRRTKDIDMIIVTETLNDEFLKKFWDFINEGEYKPYKSKDNRYHFYRFITNKEDYPKMIELFSKKETSLDGNGVFTPIEVSEEISSLSAIILNDDYYNYLLSGKIIVNDLAILDVFHLIAFKAKAHVDLTNKHIKGEFVNEVDLKKHKNDIFRLLQLVSENSIVDSPSFVKADIKAFIDIITKDDVDLKALTNNAISYQDAIELIKKMFDLSVISNLNGTN